MLEYINARHGNQSDAERKTEFKSQLRQRQNAAREQRGRPPRPETPPAAEVVGQPPGPLPTGSQLVEVVEREGFGADWGFVLFRLDYGDEESWERFEEAFNDLLEKSIVEDEKGSMGIGRIEQGLMVKMVVDPQLEEAGMEDVRRYVAFIPSSLDRGREKPVLIGGGGPLNAGISTP